MGNEKLNGAKNGTPESGGRTDVLFRASEVIKLLKQPKLESLYKRHKRPFPSDGNYQKTLTVFYAARLCFRINGGLVLFKGDRINGVRPVGLDEVLQGDSIEERKQTAERMRPEIDFVRGLTPFNTKGTLITEKVPDIED